MIIAGKMCAQIKYTLPMATQHKWTDDDVLSSILGLQQANKKIVIKSYSFTSKQQQKTAAAELLSSERKKCSTSHNEAEIPQRNDMMHHDRRLSNTRSIRHPRLLMANKHFWIGMPDYLLCIVILFLLCRCIPFNENWTRMNMGESSMPQEEMSKAIT